MKGDGEYAEWGPGRGTAAAADHAGGATFGAGRQVLEEIRELYSANAETLFRTNQFQPRLATRLGVFDSDKRHDQQHGKPTGNIVLAP